MFMLTELWCSGPHWSVLMGLAHILAVCLGFTHAGKGKSFNMSHVRLSLQTITGDESLMLLWAWGLSTWSCSPWNMGAPVQTLPPTAFFCISSQLCWKLKEEGSLQTIVHSVSFRESVHLAPMFPRHRENAWAFSTQDLFTDCSLGWVCCLFCSPDL